MERRVRTEEEMSAADPSFLGWFVSSVFLFSDGRMVCDEVIMKRGVHDFEYAIVLNLNLNLVFAAPELGVL